MGMTKWLVAGGLVMGFLGISAYSELITESRLINERDLFSEIEIRDSYSEFCILQTTIVQMNGGVGDTIYCGDSSILRVDGGRGTSITMFEESTLFYNSGTFDYIEGVGKSSIHILNTTSGSTPYLYLIDEAELNLFNGQLGSISCNNNSVMHVFDGSAAGLFIHDASSIFLWEGLVTDIAVLNESQAHLYGGQVAEVLIAEDFGQIHIYGYGFGYDLGAGAFDGGQVTGFWQDNTAFSIDLTAGTYDHITFHAIPEPATCILLLSGFAAVSRGIWYRNKEE